MATIYRAENIGSLLRPAYLQEARLAWEAGRLSTREFKRIEDRAVDEGIALQEAVGLEILTDGEIAPRGGRRPARLVVTRQRSGDRGSAVRGEEEKDGEDGR